MVSTGTTVVSVAADGSSSTQTKSGAALSASAVVGKTQRSVLSAAMVNSSERKSTATDFSPMPRKPPTPMTAAAIWPLLSKTISVTLPISSASSPVEENTDWPMRRVPRLSVSATL
ncbi:hypothetical protein D9M68_992540 [compost metagenome]